MRSYSEQQEATTANYGPTQVSGVHDSPTQPAPYLEGPPGSELIGSIPLESLTALFQPIASLRSGRTLAFEAMAYCSAVGLTDTEELFARAAFEKKVGQLGRTVRGIALTECPGAAVFVSVHPHELKDSWLIRPDDPISGHDGEIYLQLDQPSYSPVCMHVLTEVASRSGTSLVVDDFGASGSNLKQVIDLCPSFVKLDVELVRDIDRNQRKRKVVSTLVQLCSELGAHVIAKDIETEAELRALADCGVSYGQGLFLGRPSALPSISKWSGLR